MTAINAKKYLLVIDQIRVGGAERILLDYYQHLLSQGHEVKIYSLHYVKNGSIWTDNIPIEYGEREGGYPPRKIFLYFYIFSNLKKLVNEFDPDVIFSFLEKSNLLSFFAKGHRKTIFTVHNLLSIQYQKIQSKLVKNIFFTVLKAVYSSKKSTVVAVSEQVKDDLVMSFKIRSENIVVINNRVDSAEVKLKSSEIIDDFNFQAGMRYIINIGRFTQQKAQSKLIRAFSLAIKNNVELSDVSLILMGEGEDEVVLRELVSEMNLTDRVIFLPFKSNPYKYLVKVEFLVLSSDFEGFPIVIAEACSLSVPFIGTDRAIPREMFQTVKMWKSCIVSSSDHDSCVLELSSLIQKCLNKSEFTTELQYATSDWNSKNDKKIQFEEYDFLVRK